MDEGGKKDQVKSALEEKFPESIWNKINLVVTAFTQDFAMWLIPIAIYSLLLRIASTSIGAKLKLTEKTFLALLKKG